METFFILGRLETCQSRYVLRMTFIITILHEASDCLYILIQLVYRFHSKQGWKDIMILIC